MNRYREHNLAVEEVRNSDGSYSVCGIFFFRGEVLMRVRERERFASGDAACELAMQWARAWVDENGFEATV
jgi:hypothetical protein